MPDLLAWLLAAAIGPALAPAFAGGAEPRSSVVAGGTLVAALGPLLLAEVWARRRRRETRAGRLLTLYPYSAAIAAAASLAVGRLPAWWSARHPDAGLALEAAVTQTPALLAVVAALLGEQRLFAADGRFVPPRLAERVRLALAPLAVPVVLAGVFDLVLRVEPLRVALESYEAAEVAAFVVLGALAILALPTIVRVLLPTRDLPRGELRDVFEAIASRFGVRIRSFRVLDTGDSIANAALVGFGVRRMILVTDRLLRRHPPDELVAVVGHELGHAAARHDRLFILFVVALGSVALAIPPETASAIGPSWSVAAAGVALLVVLRFAFGPISRRCEHEADLYGVAAVGSAAPLVGALERIAGPVGRPRSGWRHPPIDARARFLREATEDPVAARRPARQLRRVRAVLLAVTAISLTAASIRMASRLPEERVSAALRSGHYETAAALAESAGPALEDWRSLARVAAATNVRDPRALRDRAVDALTRGSIDEAARFWRLAALRGARRSDALLADALERCASGDAAGGREILSGAAAFAWRDPLLAPHLATAIDGRGASAPMLDSPPEHPDHR